MEGVAGELNLFRDRFTQSFDGIANGLTDALKSGASVTDFRKTIMDMLRNMAIEAAIIASGFQEKFKEIGVMIAEALKDGFSETELAAIDLRVNALYSSASNAINPLNELFARAGNAQNITNGGGTTINITTTNDPLTIANAVDNIEQSLAYQGVVA
jgi:pantothenate kinase